MLAVHHPAAPVVHFAAALDITQTSAMESLSMAMLLLYPLVRRCIRFSLSLNRE